MDKKRPYRKTYDWNKEFEKRLRFSVGMFAFVFLILVLRLWFLQIVNHEYYVKLSEENRLKIEKIRPLRGRILDRNGSVLAGNRFSYAVFIERKKLSDEKIFYKLSEVLGTTPDQLKAKAEKSRFSYGSWVLLEKDVDFEKVSYLKERKEDFEGVKIDYLSLREYPFKNLASHIIGYVGEASEDEIRRESSSGIEKGDIVGKTGIERVYESFLRGIKGRRIYEVDALGNIRKVVSEEPAIAGKDVHLTIDAKVQKQAEIAIRKAIERAHQLGYKNASAGAVVVIEVDTGRILALASYPDFDPNLFVAGIDPETWRSLTSEKSGFPLINRATKAGYPPGSTFKPVTLISAFENGKTYSGETFNCQGRWFGFGKDWAKSCWKKSGHGHIGLVSSLSQSCDTVYYELGYRLYKTKLELLQKTSREMNFGSKTGIEIGEIEGRVPDKAWKKNYFKRKENQIWLPGDTVNMAIGQGDMLATPIQIARFYAALANGGKFLKPYLVEKVTDSDGTVVRKNEPELERKVNINRTALRIIRQGLLKTVKEGTAKFAFQGFPIEVAGKTGTSQVYGKDDYSLFAGYAPFDDPKYAICVVIEQGGHGGEVAAPAARFVLSSIFGVGETELVKAVDLSR